MLKRAAIIAIGIPLVGILLSTRTAFGQSPAGGSEPNEEAAAAGGEQKGEDVRLDAMRARAELLRGEFADEQSPEPLTLIADPIFRYGDPTRVDADAAVWLWTNGRQPTAILCISINRPPAAKWTYELTSLSDRPLKITRRPLWSWQPERQERKWIDLGGDVPATPRLRLAKLRSLAREFTGTQTYQGQRFELRLLPSPLYGYGEGGSDVLDGALFVLAHERNPELLLQIEARGSDVTSAQWVASCARLSSAELEVRRSDAVAWTAEQVGPRYDSRGVYYATWGSDPVPGADLPD